MDWLNKLFNKKTEKKRIFLDYASATPVLREVKAEMEPYWLGNFYNPSAIYEEGLKAKEALEDFRARVAKILIAGKQEIIFTSGGTESDNLAILGVFEEAKKTIDKPHIIISSIEHPAVARAAEECHRRGGEVSVVEVNEDGVVELAQLKTFFKKNTVLVSIGQANSEIGTVQPIARIGRLVKEERKARGSEYPLLHTDASSAPSYLPVTLEGLQADLITLDGAKIYGPKGVGILATKRGVNLHPIIFGGSQEKGLRGGTPALPLVAGFTKALEVAERDREAETKRLESLRQIFVTEIVRNLPQAIVNGSAESRLPNIVSVSIPGILSEYLLLKLDQLGVAVSVGSACSYDEKVSGSPVIRALGRPELSESTLRFSFGRFIDEKQLHEAIKIFCLAVQNMLK
jgi:cysteine desulfurase